MMTPMPGKRLSPSEIRDHLALESGEVCGIVRQLRRMVIGVAPGAVEAIKFNALSYFLPNVPFGSIGGNICMIEARQGEVRLSFILGADLPDPHGLLQGSGKSKRFVPIPSRDAAAKPQVVDLVRASAEKAGAD